MQGQNIGNKKPAEAGFHVQQKGITSAF